jgi:hypothetical protein
MSLGADAVQSHKSWISFVNSNDLSSADSSTRREIVILIKLLMLASTPARHCPQVETNHLSILFPAQCEATTPDQCHADQLATMTNSGALDRVA